MLSLADFRLLPATGRRSAVSAIGLEFADAQLNLVQLERAHPPLIRAHASVPYPVERAALLSSAAAARTFVKQALRTGAFTGRKVVSVLPASDVRILSVSYQLRANETDEQAIAKLVQERMGSDLGQFVIDYIPVRTEPAGGDHRAMVLISERSTVIAYLDLLHKVGLEVEALEVGPVAIRRLVATLIDTGDAPQNVLVINTGAHKTFLTMVSGQRLLFDQEVAFGESALLEQVAIALDVTHERARAIVFRHGVHPRDAGRPSPQGVEDTASMNIVLTIVRPHFATLVAEIERGAAFTSSETRGARVDHVYLTGSIARWPGADALLSSLTDLPVTTPRPLPIARGLAEAAAPPHPDLVIAAGLALRGFIEHA